MALCFKGMHVDYFESIVKTLLENDGYWVRQSFKVNLTKEEKRDVGKPTIPRPEIDLLAYKPHVNVAYAIEAKSFLDSPGVIASALSETHKVPEGRYKLFTCDNYREIVLGRLRRDLIASGMADRKTKITLGLAAGKIHEGGYESIRNLLHSKG